MCLLLPKNIKCILRYYVLFHIYVIHSSMFEVFFLKKIIWREFIVFAFEAMKEESSNEAMIVANFRECAQNGRYFPS